MTNNLSEQSHFPTRRPWAKDGLVLDKFIRQTEDANLYHVTKISLYLPVNVDNIYTNIRNFMPGSSFKFEKLTASI